MYFMLLFYITETMLEARPMIDSQSKKVLIKTIETRDGHVSIFTVHLRAICEMDSVTHHLQSLSNVTFPKKN